MIEVQCSIQYLVQLYDCTGVHLLPVLLVVRLRYCSMIMLTGWQTPHDIPVYVVWTYSMGLWYDHNALGKKRKSYHRCEQLYRWIPIAEPTFVPCSSSCKYKFNMVSWSLTPIHLVLFSLRRCEGLNWKVMTCVESPFHSRIGDCIRLVTILRFLFPVIFTNWKGIWKFSTTQSQTRRLFSPYLRCYPKSMPFSCSTATEID